MKITLRNTAIALAGITLGLAAQAQHARVESNGAEQARANLEASMRAAARGQKVGMISGRLNPQPERLANGAVVQELDAGTMMYSVARMNADGKVEMVCVNGSEAAEKALKAPVFAKRTSQVSKEQTHVK
ncbi:MAG: hypothetical protein Q7U73_01440 [Rubrivivax sp.]|nr:hypothetical protein [Rubrivivax sp.]